MKKEYKIGIGVVVILVAALLIIVNIKKTAKNELWLENEVISILVDANYGYNAMCTKELCTISYKSTDEEVFTVNEEGEILGKSVGEAKLIIESEDIKKEATVYVASDEIMVTGINIKEDNVSLKKGDKKLLELQIYPSRANNINLIWSTSDSEVATINNGYIEAKSDGEAEITVKVDDMEISDTIKVTVGKGATEQVESITFEQEVITMGLNESYQLEPIIRPVNSKNKNLIYTVEDENIIEVDDKGVIKSKAKGKTNVYIFSTNGVSSNVEVKVEPSTDDLAINTEGIVIARGESYQLKSNYVSGIEWYSSNNKVATVNSSGVVRGISNGEATITVINNYGRINTAKVIVQGSEIPVTSIILDKSEISLKPGGSYQINASVLPNNATNKELTWETSDSRIATVTDEGEIIGLMTGEAIITAYSKSGRQSIVRVKVNPNAVSIDSLEISPNNITLQKGDSFQLTAQIVPSNATNKEINWTSSDTSIVSIDSNGKIYGNKTGSAVITATTDGFISKITVEVKTSIIEISEIKIEEEEIRIKVGETSRLTVNYLPSNATNKEFIYESSNNNISISNKGVISGLKEGTATVTVKSMNQIKDTITVVVEKAASSGSTSGDTSENPSGETTSSQVTEVLLNLETVNLHIGQTKQMKATILPLNAVNNRLTWISSNESVATISSSGLIIGINPGTAQISVVTENGKVARAQVTITNPPIYDSGEKLIELYSEKLIVTMTKESSSKIKIIRVWAADPYNQFHKVDAQNGSSDIVSNIINNAITANKLENSIIVGGNSLFTRNGQRNGNLNITEGNVNYYNPGGDRSRADGGNTLFYAGIANNGNLQYYCTNPKSNCANGSVKAEDEQAIFETIIADGVRNTIPLPYESMMIWNGKVIDLTWDTRYAIRHTLCQVDSNNFIITVSSNGDRTIEHQNIQISLGCKNGINLDGGGSANVFYKSRGSSSVTMVQATNRARPDAIFFAEY